VNTAEVFDHPTDDAAGGPLALAPDVVEVRRIGGLAAVIGAGASAVAIAYLGRATHSGAVLDWLLFAVMGVVAAVYLRSFVDARTPLLVADAQGVRIRLGRTWRGLPWGALASVQHTPRRGLVRDGRLVLEPRNPAKALAELDASGRRASALNNAFFGTALVVPLGVSTRVAGAGGDLTAALSALSGGSATVVEVLPFPAPEPDEVGQVEELEPEPAARAPRLRDPRPAIAAVIDGIAARVPRFLRTPVETTYEEETVPLPAISASATPAPLRETRAGSRAEVTRDIVRGAAALDPAWEDDSARRDLPEARELRRQGSVNLVEDTVAWGSRVRPIAQARDSVEPLVLDEFAAEPAADPVIGPELAAARTRIGLTVDQLADRTRIRPHVIESIEVDDFAPCGGDFYARGHLRTLARVLGVDAAPLLSSYDERYSDAPINPRRVFEAELATGMHGSIRAMRGGPNWTLMIGVVMALILAWSFARLVMSEPHQITRDAPVLNGSPSPHHPRVVASPVLARFTATGPAHLVGRDGRGAVIFSGDVVAGQVVRKHLLPPVTVKSSDGGAVTAVVDGRDHGTLGQAGKASTSTFVAR
jgi:hypothetical protein